VYQPTNALIGMKEITIIRLLHVLSSGSIERDSSRTKEYKSNTLIQVLHRPHWK